MPTHTQQPSLQAQVLAECQAMARYAFTNGLKIPASLFERLEDLSAKSSPAEGAGEVVLSGETGRLLAQIHARLTEIVAPAQPRTILLLKEEKERRPTLLFLGEVPLIRRLMLVSILSLAGLVLVGISPQVDGEPQDFSLLKNDGISLLLNQLFLLAAASLGASFANLIQSQKYIARSTFDPKYESSYWINYVLGLMSGFILAVLLPIDHWLGAGVNAAGEGGGALHGLAKPTLAILGGYSTAAVYRIIDKLISAVESLVSGNTDEAVEAQRSLNKARLAEKEIQNRIQLASRLADLQTRIGEASDPDAVREELKRYQQQLLNPEIEDEMATQSDSTNRPAT